MIKLEQLKFDERGLIPVIAQDEASGAVLMLAYANKEALMKTEETRFAHYFSRSRNELWFKGKTSGNVQEVREIAVDCDGDAVLYRVAQQGVACHNGTFSCFSVEGRAVEVAAEPVLQNLYRTIADRRENPREGSYTNYLFDKGLDKILKKVGEETAEVIIASKNPAKEELIYEVADLFYHLSVLMVEKGVKVEEIFEELKRRQK